MNLKKEFEISLWEDFMDHRTGEQGDFRFINEQKICTIAADTLNHPSAAYNVVFRKKTDGTHELTFDIDYRYWDVDEQDFVDNTFVPYLYNEAKVKLHYKDKWYDFLIKSCQENSKEKKFSYVCKDLYIDELGRNGYGVELAIDLGNGVGNLSKLAPAALDGSDWQFDEEKSIRPIQKISEVVYAYDVGNSGLEYYEINEDGTFTEEEGEKKVFSIKPGETIFICYTCANDKSLIGENYQFYYNENGYYETADDGTFINTTVKCLTKNRIDYNPVQFTFMSKYRGYRYVHVQKTEWKDKINRQVGYYEDEDGNQYYGYQKTIYLTPSIAQNVLINSKPELFDGTRGWRAKTTVKEKEKECEIELSGNFGYDENSQSVMLGGPTALKAYYRGDNNEKVYPQNVVFENLAFEYNLKTIGELVKDDVWVYRAKTVGTISFENFYEVNPNDDFQIVTPGDEYYYTFLKVQSSMSQEQLRGKPLKLYMLTGNGTYGGGEFFRCYTFKNKNGENELIVPESDITQQNLIKNECFYFTDDEYDACHNEQSFVPKFVSDTELKKVYYANFEKVSTIEVKESNYFNILQTLCEKFECWADFEIDHEENGAIRVDENGKRLKKVVFKEYIGKENYAGFKYGINLDSIQRTIDSEEITTKTIVKANSNEFAKDGSCNIARATSNYSGSQSIINFDYFARQGILDKQEIDFDLYLTTDGYLGYYNQLNTLNLQRNKIEEEIIALDNSLMKTNSLIQATNVSKDEFLEDINNINEKLSVCYIDTEKGIQLAVGDYSIFYPKKELSDWGQEWEYKTSIQFYRIITTSKKGQNGETVIEETFELYSPGSTPIRALNEGKELVDKYNKFLKENYNAKNARRKDEAEKAKWIAQRDGTYSYIDVDGIQQTVKLDNIEDSITHKTRALDKEFFGKYSRFLREGTWTSEDYTDDELYYLDACSVAYTSAFPKTTYSISVIDVSNDDEYSNYDFNCGDLTTIEDTEFFGWVRDAETGLKRPYRENVIISEIEEHLDNYELSKITVQNYKTQFDDLFQRIAAATQTLELKQGQYNKAAQVVDSNGKINEVFLNNSLKNNNFIIENAGAQNVTWDSRGIVAIDLLDEMLQTKIVGGGIVITEDGGTTWTTGISGKGINASSIRTGNLDTTNIRILNGEDESFVWNVNGIYGFERTENNDGYNYSNFTKMDQFGFYCVEGDADFLPNNKSAIWESDVVPYCLTKQGLRIGPKDNGIILEKNKDGKFQVTVGDVSIVEGHLKIDTSGLEVDLSAKNIKFTDESGTQVKTVAMGTQIDNTNYAIYASGNGTFSVDYNGNIFANSGKIGGWTIGIDPEMGDYLKNTDGSIFLSSTGYYGEVNNNIDSWVLYTKGNFGVTNSGKLYATGADISGHIEADSGKIGGFFVSDDKASLKWKTGDENNPVECLLSPTSSYIQIQSGTPDIASQYYSTEGITIAWQGIMTTFGSLSYDEQHWIGISNYVSTSKKNVIRSNISPNGFLQIELGYRDNLGIGAYGSLKGVEWYYNNATIAVTGGSDSRLKHSIQYPNNKYDKFYDSLEPVTFIYSQDSYYNLGTSQRTHFGFIADAVEKSLIDNGLSTQEFAGYILQTHNSEFDNGTRFLKYDEFIALNTWQIQKLKTRVTELENEIAQLKQNLQNPQNSDII